MSGNKPIWAIKMIFLVLSVISVLTACDIGAFAVPTKLPIPNVPGKKEPGPALQSVTLPDESPRQGPEINLPPTWTPVLKLGQETPVPAPIQPAENSSNLRRYIVQAGDTLAGIAIQFEVTLDALAQFNNITDKDHIEIGQELVIPSR